MVPESTISVMTDLQEAALQVKEAEEIEFKKWEAGRIPEMRNYLKAFYNLFVADKHR